MSLELLDLPTKVHPEVHSYFKARAEIERLHINDLVRQVLHDYVLRQLAIHSLADEICKSKGLSGIRGEFK